MLFFDVKKATHLHDLPDFTLWLQFVQLYEGRPNRLVAPQETAVRRHAATESPKQSQHGNTQLIFNHSDMNAVVKW